MTNKIPVVPISSYNAPPGFADRIDKVILDGNAGKMVIDAMARRYRVVRRDDAPSDNPIWIKVLSDFDSKVYANNPTITKILGRVTAPLPEYSVELTPMEFVEFRTWMAKFDNEVLGTFPLVLEEVI